MKKVIVVSKTHLDLGFTDYAANVLDKYLTQYIPNAISTANEVNSDEKKRFVWTTGSWLLRKALEQDHDGTVREALRSGNIAPHALPFTLHTELLDEASLDYALSLVDELDSITGAKTTAAKMTDVPGHTISLVPILAKHGIKLLHIGVNGASAMPKVPECFLWRHSSGAEVVVIYSASYGGAFRCDLVDEILYFDHTIDNRGARNTSDTIRNYEKIQAMYPDYQVEAGRMDDYADAIWQVRHQLPLVTSEIGDTWIHGVATDPYKTGALKELIRLKNDAVASGTISTESSQYRQLMDAILCVAEHTWGGDSKVFLSDYCHYDKAGFAKAREDDNPSLTPEVLATEYGSDVVAKRATGEYNPGSYRAIEEAWQEQRRYIQLGISALPPELRAQAESRIATLIPSRLNVSTSADNARVEKDGITLVSTPAGAVDIYCGDELIMDSKGRSPIQYTAFSADDYDCWLGSYTRDFDDNHLWSLPDFCRPFLHQMDGKVCFGDYQPRLVGVDSTDDSIAVVLCAADYEADNLGCPRQFCVEYTIVDRGVDVSVSWYGKDASRIPEATMLRFYPTDCAKVLAQKCGSAVDISDIVENGNRRLFATERIVLSQMDIVNHHSPLCIPGMCNLVQFSNDYPSAKNDGISFVLHDSIWGTNFPLWYEDNAKFDFSIIIK